MKTSKAGLDLIKHFEGLHLEAYYDPIGIPTIGYGHIQDVYMGQVITKEQANEFLREDVEIAENAVNQYVTFTVPINQNQFDALVSLVYNVGSHNIFTKHYNNGYVSGSSLYNLLLQRLYDDASKRFEDFVKADGQVLNGLVRRRKAERDLFKKKHSPKHCSQCGQLVLS